MGIFIKGKSENKTTTYTSDEPSGDDYLGLADHIEGLNKIYYEL